VTRLSLNQATSEQFGHRSKKASAVIEGKTDMGAIIIARSDGVEQWATAYNVVPGE
jgi:hypothetical protein